MPARSKSTATSTASSRRPTSAVVPTSTRSPRQTYCSSKAGPTPTHARSASQRCRDGLTDDAADYLLTLKRTRYNDGGAAKEAAIADMTQDQLLAEILDERARELAFEGHRWFDLRRTTRPRLERTYRGETYVLEQDDPRSSIRIPSEAIAANPGLAD